MLRMAKQPGGQPLEYLVQRDLTSMREGPYEVELLRGGAQRDVRFEERKIDGVDYVISEPGQAFVIRATIHPDKLGAVDVDQFRIHAKIDGIDVGYVKKASPKLTEKIEKKFVGYRVPKTDVLREFVFALPVQVEGKPPTELTRHNNPLGTITIDFYESEQSIPRPAARAPSRDQPLHVDLPQAKVYEDKKFYEQASTVTAAGAKLEKKFTGSSSLYRSKDGRLLHSLTLRYVTVDCTKHNEDAHQHIAPCMYMPLLPFHLDIIHQAHWI
jgi:hypothetical protein